MRAIQTTKVSFKAIQIPVRVCNVIKSNGKTTGLNNACPDCKGDLSKIDVCKKCDKEIAYHDIQKKYKLTDTDQRVLTKEELDQLSKIDSSIKVIGRIPKDTIRSSLILGSYYLLPSTKLKKKSEQQQVEQNKSDYAILRESISLSETVFIVKFSIRQKEKLGVLTVEDDCIVLLNLSFNEYVQENDEQDVLKSIGLDETQTKLSKKFLESIPETSLTKIPDSYRQTLERILEGKPEPQDKVKETSDMWGSL